MCLVLSTVLSRLAPPAPCRDADDDRSDPASAGRGQSTSFEIAHYFNPAFPESSLSQGLVSRSSGKTWLPYGMTRHALNECLVYSPSFKAIRKRMIETEKIVNGPMGLYKKGLTE